MLYTVFRMLKRDFFPFLVFISVVLLLGCSENSPAPEDLSSETGSIAFNIVLGDTGFEGEGSAIPRVISDECGTATQFEISGVGATVFSTPAVTGSWSCSAGSGILSNVNPGNNLRLVIIGYNASAFGNRTIYSGETRVNVTAGGTSTPTIVVETFAVDKISPVQDATGIDPDSITFNWSPAAGANSYVLELWNRADSDDPDFETIFSQAVINTSYTYTGGLAENTTYYWAVFPVDIAGDSAYDYGRWGFTTAGTSGDNTPPTVIVNVPTGTDVPLNTDISVTFSELMDMATITNASFRVSDGDSYISGAIDNSGAMVTFNPAADLEPGVTYIVTIVGGSPGGVTDLAGNFLASNFNWSFMTAATPPPGLIWNQDNWDAANWN